MPINYLAFDKKFSFKQTASTSISRLGSYLKAANPIISAVVVISLLGFIIGALILTILAFSDYSSTNESGSLMAFLLFLVIDLVIVGLVLHVLSGYGKRALVYELFAKDNGFKFQPMFSVRNLSSFMFKIGYLQIARNAVTGTLNNKNFTIFEYRYTTGNYRYQYPVIFTVLVLNISKEFPHIILKNKRGHLVLGKPKPKAVHLDSPLNENFNIYSDSGEIASASSILKPAVIEQLLQASPKVDIEINGKDVFVFAKNTHNKIDRRVIENLIKAVQAI